MTIKHAAQLTGISQANIRYYESEGLVHPGRSENGYRDYSEADIELLLRIKLLRMLGLSIELIQEISRGETCLKDALPCAWQRWSRMYSGWSAAARSANP